MNELRNYPEWEKLRGRPVPLEEMARLDRLARRVETLAATGGEGAQATSDEGGLSVLLPPEPFCWARITGHPGSTVYEFVELLDDGGDPLAWLDGDYSGVAQEVGDNPAVPDGTIVQVFRAHNERWRFKYDVGPGGGTFTGDVTFINVNVTFDNVFISIINGTVFDFGTTVDVSVPPPGVLSKPTQLVTGTPTWVPDADEYPLLWGATDHIEWEYDGSDWVPFLSVGRTPVNDTDHTAVTTDRLIGYTTLTAARTVTLPLAGSMPAGSILRIQDETGDASLTKTISFATQGSDSLNGTMLGALAVATPYGGATAETDGVSTWTMRQGTSGAPPATGGLVKYTLYDSSGSPYSWVPAATTTRIVVEVIAGGAGGAGAQDGTVVGTPVAGVGGGGGAGGFTRASFTASSYGSGQTVTVGSGGAGGAGNAAGSAGGTSSFGALLSATGGAGGTNRQSSSGFALGGGGGTGGANGSPGMLLSAGAGTAQASAGGCSGNGGDSPFGGAGLGVTASSNGNAANGYGSGGGGALSLTTGGSKTGGAGSAGCVVVYEYTQG